MRPTLLDPFFLPITKLPKIGSKLCQSFCKLLNISSLHDTPRFVDLLHLMPNRVVIRHNKLGIKFLQSGEYVTLTIRVDKHFLPEKFKGNIPYRVSVSDQSGSFNLLFFHAQRSYLEQVLPIGSQRIVSGRISLYKGQPVMAHPDFIVQPEDGHKIPHYQTVYPLSEGISQKLLKSSIEQILENIADLPEWLTDNQKETKNWPSYKEALRQIHQPNQLPASLLDNPARQRLAYDEFLAGQLALGLMRIRNHTQTGPICPPTQQLTEKFLKLLPFDLTTGQKIAWDHIRSDLSSGRRMLRLLQGDVGAGKTVLAVLAALQIIENQGQAAIMAPTEILASQHAEFIETYLSKLGVKIALLTSSTPKKQRDSIYQNLEKGELSVVIGTHALIQEHIQFKSLKLAVIDEQHRFGVEQRLGLTSKGWATHLLVMTATPIPRTLVLTAFGDMDVTSLTEKPKGRKSIKTTLLSVDRLAELIIRLQNALNRGEKIYWICPVIEETESLKLTSVLERFDYLQKIFPKAVGLVHGKMSAAQKHEALQKFAKGETRLLVATTVIEVGIDIKDASIMIIEHAERFGLAQLHQLRGRVGRSDKVSFCLLLYKAPLSAIARKRLEIVRHCDNGFYIANEDLHLRGEGDILGTKQSGLPDFKLACLEKHEHLLLEARKDVSAILKNDPQLKTPRGQALRLLLYLFRQEQAIKLLSAG